MPSDPPTEDATRRPEGREVHPAAILTAPTATAPPRPGGVALGRHALFLALTFWTMTVNGAWLSPDRGTVPIGAWWFLDGSFLRAGLPFSISLVAILGAHEMGHYVACRLYRVDASLPWFLPGLPAPIGLFGTFGAFIRIRSPFPHRNALFDIGIAGPVAGFVVALPIMIGGLIGSEVVRSDGMTTVDVPLLWDLLSRWIGDPPEGYGRLMSGPLLASWVGCLATALNLLPIGQLDGGHVCYAIASRFHRAVSAVALAGFIGLGLFLYPGWIFFAMLLILFSPRHPPVLDEALPLSVGRRTFALVGLILLIICFIPRPLHL